MNFKATPIIDRNQQPACNFEYQIGKREENYKRVFDSIEARDKQIDRTRYDWLQANLERVVNNIRHLAANVHQDHYRKFDKQLGIVQALKMKYNPATPSKVLIDDISTVSETFYKLCPPKDSRYYKTIKSQITSLVLYCEMN